MDVSPHIAAIILAVATAVLGWIMHKVKQKEARIDSLEARLTIVEKSTAVQNSQLSDIRHRLKDVQETLKVLVSQHMK